jgi:hypothetical protein
MAQFDRLPEIDASLRLFLLADPAISALVGGDLEDEDNNPGRVFYFRPSMPEGREPEVPFILFRRAGGVPGSYRYYFSIRTKDPSALISLRRAVVRRLLSAVNLATNENIVESYLEGQITDGGDESTGWYESNFYMVFELLEAGYG